MVLGRFYSSFHPAESDLLRGSMTRSIDALFDELESRDDYGPARFVEKLGGEDGVVTGIDGDRFTIDSDSVTIDSSPATIDSGFATIDNGAATIDSGPGHH